MSNVFFTSDLHIGHKLVAGLRGFWDEDNVDDDGNAAPDTLEHARTVAAIWDATVKPSDTVFVLGDTGLSNWSYVLNWFDNRPGTKHLIAGNHDPVHPARSDAIKLQKEWLHVFATINPYTTRKIAGEKVLLSHFPYASYGDGTTHGEPGEGRWSEWRADERLGKLLIHGHTHGPERAHDGNQFHVGWDAWGGLVPMQTIVDWVQEVRPRV